MNFLPKAAILSVTIAIGAAAPAGAIRLVARAGSVQLITSASPKGFVPDVPHALGEGDQLRAEANSSIRIALAEGVALEAGAHARLRILEASDHAQVLELSEGSLVGAIPDDGTLALIVKTPSADVRPLGGNFGILIRRSRVGVKVGIGAVVVTTPKGSYRVTPPDSPMWFEKDVEPVSQATSGAARVPAIPIRLPAQALTHSRPDSLESLLDEIERQPNNLAALSALNDSVRSARSDYERRYGRLDRPLGAEERHAILRDNFRIMSARIDDEAVQAAFLQGHDAFEKGEYLTAADRFLLCRLLKPRETWLSSALDEYQKRQIPDAIRASARLGSASIQEAYLSVLAAIQTADWPAAARKLGRVRANLPEAATLQERFLGRAQSASLANPERRVADIARTGERDQERSVREIETVLLALAPRAEEAWWVKAAEGLRRAYANLEIGKLLDEASRQRAGGDLKATMRSLVAVLQKSPGNPQALEILDRMQKAGSSTQTTLAPPAVRTEGIRTGAKRPTAKPAVRPTQSPPEPHHADAKADVEAKRAPPSLAEIAQAEAYYRNGLGDYLKGDLSAAVEQWRAALRLVPDHPQATISLNRALRELGPGAAAEARR